MAEPTPVSKFEPFIPAGAVMREFTLRAVLTGTVLGMIFGASSLYLVLKVGLTVSASIPVAVISLALFRGLSKVGVRDATILENNITQTAGSAGESLAFGIGVTMPAILILGFDLELTRVMLVAMLGGLLGILMMIPLRRALIVKEHGILKYPEGTACAAVLRPAPSPECRAARLARARRPKCARPTAAGLGAVPGGAGDLRRLRRRPALQDAQHRVQGLEGCSGKDLRRAVQGRLGRASRFRPSCWASVTSSVRASPRSCAAAACSRYLVLIPMIKFFGEQSDRRRWPRARSRSPQMEPGRDPRGLCPLHRRGRGRGGRDHQPVPFAADHLARPAGGLARLRPVPRRRARRRRRAPRTERDLSMKFVGIGVIVLHRGHHRSRPRCT